MVLFISYIYISHNGQKKKYKQRSTKHTYKTKDRVTQIPLKTEDELTTYAKTCQCLISTKL